VRGLAAKPTASHRRTRGREGEEEEDDLLAPSWPPLVVGMTTSSEEKKRRRRRQKKKNIYSGHARPRAEDSFDENFLRKRGHLSFAMNVTRLVTLRRCQVEKWY